MGPATSTARPSGSGTSGGRGAPIEKLQRKHVREFLEWVYERAVADQGTNPGRTANKAREHLRAVLSWAWEQELIDAPPRFPTPRPQRDVAGRHYLTKAELNALYFGTHRMRRPRGWDAPDPVRAAFADWLAEQRPRVLPKSAIGEAPTYATNQWPALGVYLTDGRLAIDNAAAEQAIRPLRAGRRNWLHLGGDGGLTPTAVPLSLAASARRHGLNPWAYLTHILAALPARPGSADLADMLPDAWAKTHGQTQPRAG